MSKFKKEIFRGAATAIITPFKNGEIDFEALSRLIDFQIGRGIDALVITGTTGESSTLDEEEHKSILRFALEKIDGRVPAIAGTGSNNISHATKMSRYASELGYDGLLVVTPYYNKATERGLIESYIQIADSSRVPLILYNVPTRTCCNITLPVYRALAEHENIVGVKEASGNISAIAELFSECGDYFDIYSGNDDQTLPLLSLGGKGVISVVSNIIPNIMHDLCSLWFDGEIEACRKIQLEYLPLMKAMFCEVNPIPVKTALNCLGFCEEEFRLPMCQISDISLQKLLQILTRYFPDLM